MKSIQEKRNPLYLKDIVEAKLRALNRLPAFVFSQLGEMSLEVVFAVVIIVVGALILSGLGNSSAIAANSVAANTVNNGQSLLGGITSQFGLTGTIIGLMILLAVVVFFLGRGSAKGGL